MIGNRPRRFRYLLIPIAAVALATGIEWATSRMIEAPVSAADWHRSGFGPSTYFAAIADTDAQIALGQERADNGPQQWLRQESLARAYLMRSHLVFSYDDLSEAGETLARAKQLAPSGSGPLLSDAVFGLKSHQLDRADASLSAIGHWVVQADPATMAETAGLKGDIAFYRGDMSRARAHYQSAGRFGPNAGIAYRLAILAKSRGEFDAAIGHFADANPDPRASTPFANASAAMQIGGVELARGEYQAAKEWFETADRLFPGFWLIEAHLAQAKALDGDLENAIADMKDVAIKAPSAEVLDALAMLLRANGQARESRIWAKRSAAIWQKRLAQLPEAAYGHAVEHELVFGSPVRALDLARKNLAARPYGESRILLATALLSNGSAKDALDQLDLAEKSGWRSAPLYALRAQAYELFGKADLAGEARNAAQSLNPRIFDAETSLVWLSHG